MIRRRASPDGLPFRVYCRPGKRWVSYIYKHRDGHEEQLARALANDRDALQVAKRTAILKGTELNEGAPADTTFAALVKDYFTWQEALPADSERKKASSTITNNKREGALLAKVFGAMQPDAISVQHVYKYQEIRELKGAGLAANKEISLLSAIVEYGRKHGRVTENVAKGIKRVPSRPRTRRVEWDELEQLVEVARELGPAQTIMALAARTAWLTLRRPPEILSLSRTAIGDDGILFHAAKRKAGQAERSITISWSPILRETIEEVLTVKRHSVAGSWLVFGNLAGQRYSKSGWGTMWGRMMDAVQEKHPGFVRFTLQDCRPGGVTTKRERGDLDTVDATMHSDSRMVERVYDRRKTRGAKPAK